VARSCTVSFLASIWLSALLGASCDPGTMSFDLCLSDADCDDGDLCTQDACLDDGTCLATLSSAVSDDGIFCNGVEECAGGQCLHSGDPCRDSEACDEDHDTCVATVVCSTDTECGDDNACTDDVCVDDTCLVIVNCDRCPDLPECEVSPCDEEDEPAPACAGAADCDDGIFCNGHEYCDGCACRIGFLPCRETYTQLWLCDEQNDRCYQCEDAGDCSSSLSCANGLCTGFCDGMDCRSENLCDRWHCVGNSLCIRDPVDCDIGMRCHPPTGMCVPVGETCLSQCQHNVRECCALDSPGCVKRPVSDLADYETTLSEWLREGDTLCPPGISSFAEMIAGVCPDGTRVLRRNEELAGAFHTTFFDAPSGAFRATMTDTWEPVFPEHCRGHVFWPEEPACDSMTVTQVLCGEPYLAVGDVVYFDPCRMQCFHWGCEFDQPLRDLTDLATARDQLRADPECTSGHEEGYVVFVAMEASSYGARVL